MKEPKRYYCGNGDRMFDDDTNGHWIQYSEHKAIVEVLTERLRKPDVGRSVYLVVRKDDLVIFGCFDERIKAEKYANGVVGLAIQEVQVA